MSPSRRCRGRCRGTHSIARPDIRFSSNGDSPSAPCRRTSTAARRRASGDEVDDRVAEGANRGEVGLRVRAAVAHDQPDDRLAVPLLREERGRRCAAYGHERGQLARCRLGEVSVGREHLVGAFGTPDDEAAGDGRADLVQAEREPGDDAEVASTAPKRPEEFGVLVTVAVRIWPSAVTISTSSRLSAVQPKRRVR